jgi:hypothetical protein
VASAGGKISRELKEVQPGATLFLPDMSAARQEINSGTSGLNVDGAFSCSGLGFLLRKGARNCPGK